MAVTQPVSGPLLVNVMLMASNAFPAMSNAPMTVPVSVPWAIWNSSPCVVSDASTMDRPPMLSRPWPSLRRVT